MNKTLFEKRQRFSLRKTTLGLVSAAVSTFILATPLATTQQPVVQACTLLSAQPSKLNYHYVLESELSPEERASIVRELPQYVENTNGTYLLVYRPHLKEAIQQLLPQTGEYTSYIASATGLLLVLVVGLYGKHRKKKVLPILIVTGLGSVVLSTSAMALTQGVLAAYNTTYEVSTFSTLPEPAQIDGYDYVGYLTLTVDYDCEESSSVTREENSSNVFDEKETVSQEDSTSQSTSESTEFIEFVPENVVTVEKPVANVVTETVVERHVIPFETIYQQNPELPAGTEQEVQAGVAGEETTTYNVYTAEGEEIHREVASVERVEPVNRVVQQGTFVEHVPSETLTYEQPTLELVTTTETTSEPIAYDTVYETSPTLPSGTEQEVQAGVAGEETTTYNVYTAEGQEIHREVATVERVEPVNRVVQRGTLQYEDITERTPLPYTTRYEETSELPLGQEREKQAGSNGELVRTIRVYRSGDQEIRREVLSEQRTEPTDRIVERGTLQYEDITERTPLPYTTRYEETSELPSGQEREKQAGSNGELVRTIRVYRSGDQEIRREVLSEQRTEPTERIVERGTQQKEKPTVTIINLIKDEANKQITLNYILDNPTNSFVSAKAKIYDGDTLVKEVPITAISQPLNVSGLDYYKEYTVKTEIIYDLGNDPQTATEQDMRRFELVYKKIEFKDIDSVELYEKVGTELKRRLYLNNVPADLSNFIVKIKSDKHKEALLPVQAITPSTKDGTQTYEVKVAFDELAQDTQGMYQPNYAFHIARPTNAEGVYHSFSDLIKAMRANPQGKFVIGADMTADELSLEKGDSAYVPGEFTGELTGENNGQKFAIYNLAKPLFDTLNHAKIGKVDLKEVLIQTTQGVVGSLAKIAKNQTAISDVAANGSITAEHNVGGLVGQATDRTSLNNVRFDGKLNVTQNNTQNNTGSASNNGGLVGNLENRSTLTSGYADVEIYASNRTGQQRSGGLVGLVSGNASLTNSYVSGIVSNTRAQGQNGGVVGSTWRDGIVSDVVSNVEVFNGQDVFADIDYAKAKVTNVFVTKDSTDKLATKITEQEANDKVRSYNLTATTEDSSPLIRSNQYSVDYTTLSNATAERRQAYENIEKLMPFYNKELIVHYGNKLAENHKLYTTPLIDVVPMTDKQFVTDVHGNKREINRLLLHYADNTVDYLDITYKEDFRNADVVEYDINSLGLIYTPEQFVSSYLNVIRRLEPELANLAFDSPEVREVVGVLSDDNGPYGRSLTYLFLRETFDALKQDLATNLRKVLSMDKSINTMGSAVEDTIVSKIKSNKAAFLIGLSYLNRWYNVNFGDINTKELTAYKFDFFGDNTVSTLDAIINIGKSGFDNLVGKQNDIAYRTQIAPYKKQKDVFSYLNAYRELFLPNKNNNEWIKENSKAYIVETKSAIDEVRAKQDAAYNQKDNKYSIGVYDKISSTNWKFQNMLLPLLTMQEESVYVISNLATISFGGYERYTSTKEIEAVRTKVNQAANWQRDHQDFWYKILTPESRDKLFRSVLNYDGFGYQNSQYGTGWRNLDAQDPSIKEFFGPVGKYFRDNGSGAYANGSETNFVADAMLTQYGTSVYTHEMVHNSDGSIYFEGRGRREGQGAELYALGLLQNVRHLGMEALGLNTMFTGDFNAENRYHTANPVERFNNVTDLNEYVRGMLDVVYVLDYMEANAIVSQTNDVKKVWLRKIENFYEGNHAGNKIRQLTDVEVSQLTTVDSLIEHNILNQRAYGNEREFKRNGYHTINLFSPIYAALDNPNGAPGDVMFRRMAYELFAEKGYHDGFLPYISNQYRKNQVLTDNIVFQNIFGTQYTSWSDFKKAMYQKRVDQLPNLKPITIRYELGNDKTTKTVSINSHEDMQRLINEAMNYDIQHNLASSQTDPGKSWVHKLKRLIYNAYIRDTDDFRESIFKTRP